MDFASAYRVFEFGYMENETVGPRKHLGSDFKNKEFKFRTNLVLFNIKLHYLYFIIRVQFKYL